MQVFTAEQAHALPMEISVRWNITWLQCHLGFYFFNNTIIITDYYY